MNLSKVRLSAILTIILLSTCLKLSEARVTPSDAVRIRIPLYLSPLEQLPQPRNETKRFYQDPDRKAYFSKVTIMDVFEHSPHPIEHYLNSSVQDILHQANQLYDDKNIDPATLHNYKCGSYCYDLGLNEVLHYNLQYSMQALMGHIAPPITMGKLHEAVVTTLEFDFCFTMEFVEQYLGFSSFNVNVDEWTLTVGEIAWYAIQCRADLLVVDRSELAELVKRNESILLQYTLDQLKNDFIPSYLNVTSKRDRLYHENLRALVSTTDNVNWTHHSLYKYIQKATNFTIRDLEILYNLSDSQLHALEEVPLSSYTTCHGVTLDSAVYSIAEVTLAMEYNSITGCAVALVLSRSISYVQLVTPAIGNIFELSVLDILAQVSNVSTWNMAASILQLDPDRGLSIDTPRIREIIKYDNVPQTVIQSLSVSEIIGTYLSNPSAELLVRDYQPMFHKMLSTYGFTVDQFLRVTQISDDELRSTNITAVHLLLLNMINARYDIETLSFTIEVPTYIFYDSLSVTFTLPSSEWSRVVSTAIQGSFNQIISVLFGNLTVTPDGIVVEPLGDYFQSISATNELSLSNYFAYDTATFTSCLNLRDVLSMNMSVYSGYYNHTLVGFVKKKIAFETTVLSSVLAARGVSLQDIYDESVSITIFRATGFTTEQLRCMYGLGRSSVLDKKITWREVEDTRLCYSFESMSFFEITMAIAHAEVTDCFGSGSGCGNCHSQAYCSGGTTCKCHQGFTGDGITCTDINECLTNTDSCHDAATCANTVGSFTCICKPGYEGNGQSCSDINECTRNTDNCHTTLAVCSNTQGSFKCTCRVGYQGDGVVCQDMNECLTNTDNCHDAATCGNTVGSFTCTCKPGYEGNGQSCSDINECTRNIDNCHTTRAVCSNTQGSFKCTCRVGYQGDGVVCQDLNECSTSPCHSDANCQNTQGSYSCSCKNGFTGNGITCTAGNGGTGSSSSSSGNQATIIGSVVGGVVLLLIAFGIVMFCVVKRRSSADLTAAQKSKDRERPRELRNVANVAYDPESSYRYPGSTYSQAGYEIPHDYAKLEGPVGGGPVPGNYETLRPTNQRPDQDSGHYAQLNRGQNNNAENYAQLNQGQGRQLPSTPSKASGPGLENKAAVNDPIYEELP